MNEQLSRTELLTRLIELTDDLEATLLCLRATVPEGDREFVQLDRSNVRHAPDQFSSRCLAADQLEPWAETIHSRDDVLLDPRDEPFLAAALFELSTPELNGSMEQIVPEIRERDRRSLPDADQRCQS